MNAIETAKLLKSFDMVPKDLTFEQDCDLKENIDSIQWKAFIRGLNYSLEVEAD